MKAAEFVGNIYEWGQGVVIDLERAMAAYKVVAEGGNAGCQWQVGFMYCNGLGVEVDYAQALPWLEKAAAQDDPNAVAMLGTMCLEGKSVTPSWRRAREYWERAIELGISQVVEDMQNFTTYIQQVTSRRSNHFALSSSLVRDLTLPPPTPPPHARRSPPSWTSGWSSTARARRT